MRALTAGQTARRQTKDDKLAQAPKSGAGGLKIKLSTVPSSPRVGEMRLLIQVTDSVGTPVSDAKVELIAAMQRMPGPNVAARPSKEPGLYEATVNLGMAGVWTVEVNVTSPRGETTSSKFTLEAK